MQDQEAIKIFIVYAREDAEALKELRAQFIPVARSERLDVWYDGEILPGQQWDREIKSQLYSADIILLFISKYFFASDYIQSKELKEAILRHSEGKAAIVPVIVRPCIWQDDFDVSKFQVLPGNAQPIFSSYWKDHDEPLVDVVEGIRKVARNLRAERIQQDLARQQRLKAAQIQLEKEMQERQRREALERQSQQAKQNENVTNFNQTWDDTPRGYYQPNRPDREASKRLLTIMGIAVSVLLFVILMLLYKMFVS